MGIHGIYKEIGPGRRVALSKYSADHYVQHSRPLRLAIDISIWLFQIQSGKGGSNPALRTFYYRLLRLLTLNIHPLFVFDGPNKPLFKRNKRVGGPNVKVSSIPEFLAKQLLKQFGFPMHLAPGEAEAECALLQREGIVDAVLSEDVDTLMFGSGTTMRSWTPEAKSSKVPTHVNVYDSKITKDGSGLDREGMILIALMSGGDYIVEGIPGCGPKTACEVARAGFGAELCKLKRRDDAGFTEWRERLKHELWTNESKLFKQRRRIDIPDDFPNREVLGYYTTPCISGDEKIAALRQSLKWDMPIDYPSLRSFTADAFDWVCISGAKKFIRNLAPAILTRELRLRGERDESDSGDLDDQAAAESRLVVAIHGRRTHATTDNLIEVRISFLPMNIINIDLSQEPPDEEVPRNEDSDSEAPVNDEPDTASQCPGSPRKRGPSKYNPEELEKIWIMDTFLRHGVPLKVQDWESNYKDPKAVQAQKKASKEVTKQKKKTGGMPRGALDQFTRVTKPGAGRPPLTKSVSSGFESVDLSALHAPASTMPLPQTAAPPVPPTNVGFRRPNISGISGQVLEEIHLAAMNRSPKRTTQPRKRLSDEVNSPARHGRSKSDTPKSGRMKQTTIIDLVSSPIAPRQATPLSDKPLNRRLDFSATSAPVEQPDLPPLPDTVTKRRKRSPFKRHETAPAALEDFMPSFTAGINLPRPRCPDASSDLEELDMALPSLSNLLAARREPTPLPPVINDMERDMTPLADAVVTEKLAESVMAAFAQPRKPREKTKVVKKHYMLRESLEGAWKEVDVELEVDLTSPNANGNSVMSAFVRPKSAAVELTKAKDAAQGKAKPRTRWRKSEVEIVDMTLDDD